jgi:hypothetical protein
MGDEATAHREADSLTPLVGLVEWLRGEVKEL